MGDESGSKAAGALILSARQRKGLTQEQVAEAIDVRQTHISAWERGARFPGRQRLARLAELLDLDIGEVIRADVAEKEAADVA